MLTDYTILINFLIKIDLKNYLEISFRIFQNIQII